MIISASRRTDIPAFYGEWFMRRLRDGFVVIPNPFNAHRFSIQSLSPDDVEAIVFWSKNPFPFFTILSEVDHLGFQNRYLFHFTLNPYYQTVFEPYLPPFSERVDTFSMLADTIGQKRIIWRYDPIIFCNGNLKFDLTFHKQAFSQLIKRLHPFTKKIVISFLDFYRKNQIVFKTLKKKYCIEIIEPNIKDIEDLTKNITEVASSYGIEVFGCCEKREFSEIMNRNGIKPGRCIHFSDIEAALPKVKIPKKLRKKDPGQRENCGCTISKDIGAYHTCWYRCGYCYATDFQRLKPNSSLSFPYLQ
ncbi:DUF1848 domain-containing protein [Atribacter laminatus]|uniref:DUF1848 domain-containing protein n=1 Tax=Atribacter laminatus TaxID=2847778 RepID=A0A7T1ALD5_ATRLM|nr:DUF1848 domain-containing protein [Atribacter laminatus]QPM68060.1 hypothetical protein RT761_01274 [Atribacter laminatus]